MTVFQKTYLKTCKVFNSFKNSLYLETLCPDSLVVKDEALSRPKPGFKSRSGHSAFLEN